MALIWKGARATPPRMKYVIFIYSYFDDNGRSGLCICLYFTKSSTPIDVTVTNNRAERNKVTGYEANSWPSPMNGSVKGSGNMQNGVAVTFPPATTRTIAQVHKLGLLN